MSSSTFPDIVLTKIHDFCVANAVIVDGEPVLFKQDEIGVLYCGQRHEAIYPIQKGSYAGEQQGAGYSGLFRVCQGLTGFEFSALKHTHKFSGNIIRIPLDDTMFTCYLKT